MANVGRFLVEEKVVYFPLLKKAYNNNVSTAKVLPMGEDLGGANKLATDYTDWFEL
jgi:hypothetical protein